MDRIIIDVILMEINGRHVYLINIILNQNIGYVSSEADLK